jgi:hypothetical protein
MEVNFINCKNSESWKRKKNEKQWASWSMKSSATNGGNSERGVCATVEDSECQREPALYSELENVFSERSNSVFWDIIWTVIDDINIALQSKKMSLV